VNNIINIIEIIDRVKKEGDSAVRFYSQKYDKYERGRRHESIVCHHVYPGCGFCGPGGNKPEYCTLNGGDGAKG